MKSITAFRISGAFFALAIVLNACTGTRLAYETAETLEAKAYVVTEHYAALIAEANDLADAGISDAALERIQAVDAEAGPAVLALRRAVETYSALRNSENEAALQQALAEAALAVSDLINAVRRR